MYLNFPDKDNHLNEKYKDDRAPALRVFSFILPKTQIRAFPKIFTKNNYALVLRHQYMTQINIKIRMTYLSVSFIFATWGYPCTLRMPTQSCPTASLKKCLPML